MVSGFKYFTILTTLVFLIVIHLTTDASSKIVSGFQQLFLMTKTIMKKVIFLGIIKYLLQVLVLRVFFLKEEETDCVSDFWGCFSFSRQLGLL